VRNFLKNLQRIGQILRKRNLSIKDEDVDKYFNNLTQDPLDIDTWMNLLVRIEASAVELIFNLNCIDVFKKTRLDINVLESSIDNEVKKWLVELSKSNNTRIKLCELMSNLSLFENVKSTLNKTIKVFNNIYDENKENCGERLVEIVSRAIEKLDVRRLGNGTLDEELKLKFLENIAKRGVKISKLKYLTDVVGKEKHLISHISSDVKEVSDLFINCRCLEDAKKAFDSLERITGNVIRTQHLLIRLFKTRDPQIAEKLDKVKTEVEESRSLDSVIKAVEEIRTINVRLLGELGELISILLEHMEAGKIQFHKIYEHLPEEKKDRYMGQLIELCREGVVTCIVSIVD
jgi:predicted RND superfamily exporter protein